MEVNFRSSLYIPVCWLRSVIPPPSPHFLPTLSVLLPSLRPLHCDSGTCQPHTQLQPLRDYLCWAPLAAGRSQRRWWRSGEGGHSQRCVGLKGLVSILRGEEGDFEEIISVWGMTEGVDLEEGMEDSFQIRGRKNNPRFFQSCASRQKRKVSAVYYM